MDLTTVEVWWIRVRWRLRVMLKLVGVGLMLLGVLNLFVVPYLGIQPVAPYRQGWLLVDDSGAFYASDILVICIGAMVAWWS